MLQYTAKIFIVSQTQLKVKTSSRDTEAHSIIEMQSSNSTSPTFATDVPNDLFDESVKQQQQVERPMVDFKVHQGFLCFFEDYVNRQGWTFYQCYKKVFESHHELLKVKRPVQDIMSDKSKTKVEKITELLSRCEKNKTFAYYLKNQHDTEDKLECNLIVHEDKRIDEVNKLKKQLEKLEKLKEKVVSQKKKEFLEKEKKREQQYEELLKQEFSEKERRAHLVYEIQREAKERQRLRKLLKESKSASGQGSSSCEIM